MKIFLRLFIGKKVFQDYEKADARVCNENKVSCVLIRPSLLNNRKETGKYVIQNKKSIYLRSISRQDLVNFMIKLLTDNSFDNSKGITIGGKK